MNKILSQFIGLEIKANLAPMCFLACYNLIRSHETLSCGKESDLPTQNPGHGSKRSGLAMDFFELLAFPAICL
jgi:hypothetical protein